MVRAFEGRRPTPIDPLLRRTRPLPLPLPAHRRGFSQDKRASILTQLRLGRSAQAVASYEGCHRTTVNTLWRNVIQYGDVVCPYRAQLGRSEELTEADKQALFEELVYHGWMFQDEMVSWLLLERGRKVHQSTVSRLIKKEGWSRKKMQLVSINQDDGLREAYKDNMREYDAEDLVFLDESLFNEKTGWRHKAYGPIGASSRYKMNISRGST